MARARRTQRARRSPTTGSLRTIILGRIWWLTLPPAAALAVLGVASLFGAVLPDAVAGERQLSSQISRALTAAIDQSTSSAKAAARGIGAGADEELRLDALLESLPEATQVLFVDPGGHIAAGEDETDVVDVGAGADGLVAAVARVATVDGRAVDTGSTALGASLAIGVRSEDVRTGDLLGAVTVLVPLDPVAAHALAAGSGRSQFLVDADGVVLAHRGEAPDAGRTVDVPVSEGLRAGIGDRLVVRGVSQVSGSGISVVSEQRALVALAPSLVLLSAVAVLVVVLLLMALRVRRALQLEVVSPLQELVETAERIGLGDLTVRVEGATTTIELRELGESIDRMAERLHAQFDALERFNYVASHDMKEPLRTIGNYAEMLRARYGDTLDDRGQRWLDQMVEAVGRQQRLIEALLAHARVQGGGEPAPVPLRSLVEEVLADRVVLLEDVEVHVEVPDELVVVVVADLAAQLLGNLVGNAAKYRAPDRAPRIEVTARALGEDVEVRVADNGIGIPVEKRQEVFAPFARLHGSEEFAGTGIGLSTCVRIVERHGGTIGLEDGIDGGVAAVFTLPAAPAPPSARAADRPADVVADR